MLSWFILWLNALSDEPYKMLSNKASLYETSQFRKLLAIKFNWTKTISQVATIAV